MAFLLVIGGAFALIESGEVVVLRAIPDDGHDFIARLWIIDHQVHQWIGKADPLLFGSNPAEAERSGVLFRLDPCTSRP